MNQSITVMLVAAEASGDALGAGLARALRVRLGAQVRFVGIGGIQMAAEGVDSPFDISELSILGWIEGMKAYGRVKRRVAGTAALAARERPDVAVLIDSWGFTIRVAKALRAAQPEMPLVKYVGPQVWASRPGRAKTLAAMVDHLLALNSFDPPWFEKEGLATTFVGNPALAVDFSGADGARFRRERDIAADAPLLLVLPGSRPGEIERLMPTFEGAVARLKADRPGLAVAVVVADPVRDQVLGRVAGWPFRAHPVQGEAAKRDAMKAATVALACSGTVSIELALAGCPMVIAYKLEALSYALVKPFLKVKHITLFNIAAGRAIAPEFVQNAATVQALSAAVGERLDDPALCARQVTEQDAALDKMGRGLGDPAEKSADAVVRILQAYLEKRAAHRDEM